METNGTTAIGNELEVPMRLHTSSECLQASRGTRGNANDRRATGFGSNSVRLRAGIQLLLQAFDYSADLSRDRWDFAVELPCLRRAGMTNSDLRWLVFKGFVEHGREVSGPSHSAREFIRDNNLLISKRTCLVLTNVGAVFCRQIIRENPLAPAETAQVRSVQNRRRHDIRIPVWDQQRQVLFWGDLLVKQYKLPSPNQETILKAFQEEGWPPRIDDPLSPHPEIDPKRRLSDTIKSLNRKQKNRLIRFMGDGSGRGIRWEPV